MTLALTQTVPPTIEPVTIAEVRQYLKLTSTARDAELKLLIEAARQRYESDTGTQLLNATFEWRLDRFPIGAIELPKPPLSSVTSIAYIDTAGDSQTLASSKYQTDGSSWPGRVAPTADEVTWPPTELGALHAVTITFVAGHGTLASAVPQNVRRAIKSLILHFNEYPDAATPEKLNINPFAYQAVVDSERVVSF